MLMCDAQTRSTWDTHCTKNAWNLGASVQGRKMSKSIGNVIDPLDVISDYGTDALRFTLATGTAPGQDLNMSMGRLGASRNLLNKVWNAAKFVQHGISEVSEAEWQELARVEFGGDKQVQQLPLAERWIVSELHRCALHATMLRARGTHAAPQAYIDCGNVYELPMVHAELSATLTFCGLQADSSSAGGSPLPAMWALHLV